MMSGIPGTAVIQITNLSSAVSSEQMRTLFGFLGDVEELRLYPPDNAPLSFSSKVCYIKYREPSSVGVAQHLTNTVFIDRALIVVPCAEGKIPEEAKALSLLAPAAPPAAPPVANLMSGAGLLPIPTPPPLQNLKHEQQMAAVIMSSIRLGRTDFSDSSPQIDLSIPISNLGALQATLDPSATALGGAAAAAQPPLMGNVDPSKVDEIRRTVYVGNLNSQTTTAEQLLEYFKQVGDVKFVRMAGDETQPTRFAFVEFADQESVSRALTFNGVMFGDRPLKINHSNNAIVKPPELTPQAAAKELEDVMKRVREAQSTIAAAIEPEDIVKKRSMSSSRRGRKSHSRTRSRSRSRRRRSHSKHRSRPSQKSRQKASEPHGSRSSHKKRSRSRDRRHSRSPSKSRDRRKDKDLKTRGKEESSRDKEERRPRERKGRTPPKSYSSSRRSHSAGRVHKRRSRSRSKSPRRKIRSPSPRRGKKDKKKERARESSRDRGGRQRSPSRKINRDKDKQERKAKPIKVERDYDKEEKEYESEGSASSGEGSEPRAQHNGCSGGQAAD